MEKIIHNKNTKILLLCVLVGIFFALPFFSTLMYSIDDYHLYGLYDLSIKNLGYNVYESGRYVQALILQVLHWFNMQPISRPLGTFIFLFGLSLLGVYVGKRMEIGSTKVRLIVSLFVVLNPFMTELYHYSIITIYCGFTVIFLTLGIWGTDKFIETKKLSFLALAFVGYVSSLATYQIFYTIVVFVLFFEICFDSYRKDLHVKKYISVFLVWVAAFLLYYIVLNIMFKIKPPHMVYGNIDIRTFIQSVLTRDYWVKVKDVLLLLLSDNVLNSKIALLSLNAVALAVSVVCLLVKHNKYVLINFLVTVFYVVFGPIVVLGFGLTRIDLLSGRDLTAFGIYEMGLFLIAYCMLTKLTEKKLARYGLAMVAGVVLLVNGSMFGRAANDLQRMNNYESSLVNRIVYRMEEEQEFTGMESLCIVGVPFLGNMENGVLRDFCSPAIMNFSKVCLFNEISGYQFQYPDAEQTEIAQQVIDNMPTWPQDGSVVYIDGMFIVRLYY